MSVEKLQKLRDYFQKIADFNKGAEAGGCWRNAVRHQGALTALKTIDEARDAVALDNTEKATALLQGMKQNFDQQSGLHMQRFRTDMKAGVINTIENFRGCEYNEYATKVGEALASLQGPN